MSHCLLKHLQYRVFAAIQAWYDAVQELREAKTWFWRFRAEQRQMVLDKKAKERAAYAVVREHDRHLESLISAAKAELGLWSELGVGEGRQLFWKSFQAGKVSFCNY